MLQPGLMMDQPLLLSDVIEHAAAQYGDVEVVSRETHGPLFRYTYADCAKRARKLAHALGQLGLSAGSAVGSIAWNNHRHLEAYYAVSGSGMVMHTCNPRLHPQQLIYVVNHAEDQVMLFDATFAPLIKGIAAHCPKVKAWVCLADAAHTPAIEGVANVLSYEDLIAPHSEHFEWPAVRRAQRRGAVLHLGHHRQPEGRAVLAPRHRAQRAVGCTPGVLSLSARETILPVVPMFHINAWCIPYARADGRRQAGAARAEARRRQPARADGNRARDRQRRRADDLAGAAAARGTEQAALHDHAPHGGGRLGDAAVADRQVRRRVRRRGAPRLGHDRDHRGGDDERADQQARRADRRPTNMRSSPSRASRCSAYDIKVVDENGADLPRDGRSQGELMVRGQWIVSGYFKGAESPLRDGWFPTGDIATIDADGVMQIRDRAKDVIKTGGEWISSIDLENAAMAHPAVAMAAVIGVKHPKWDERPLLFIVRKPGQALEKERDPRLPDRARGQVVGARRRGLPRVAAGGRHRQGAEGRPAQAVRRRVQLTGDAHAFRPC